MKRREEMSSGTNPKRQTRTVGAIMIIPIDDYFVYVQSLDFGEEVIFDYRTKTPLKDLSPLLKARELCRVSVYSDVISSGIWRKVGKLPIREDLLDCKMKFIYDKFTNRFFLYNPKGPFNIPPKEVSQEKCKGLEPVAVWGREHVEQRIRDYYEGRTCSVLKELFDLVAN